MSKKSKEAVEVAKAMGDENLDKMMREATSAAEKASSMSSVFLRERGNAPITTGTGSLMIDYITGGGVPAGRIFAISGPEHSGKSFIATEIMNQQLSGGRFADFQDAEGTTDPEWLLSREIDFEKYRGRRDKNDKLLAGEVDKFMYHQPSTGDQVMHFIHGVCSKLPENRQAVNPPPVIWVLDSVVALVSDAVSEDIDSNRMAMHAKMYAEVLPVVNSALTRTGCSLVYVNQIRSRPGVSFGSPNYEPCGSALQFFSSIRLELSRSKPKSLKGDDHPLVASDYAPGTWKEGGVYEEMNVYDPNMTDRSIFTAIKTIKNKMHQPRKVCWIKINFEQGDNEKGRGLDAAFDVFSFLLELGGISKDTVPLTDEPGERRKKTIYKVAPTILGIDMNKEFPDMPKQFTYNEWRAYVHGLPTRSLYSAFRKLFITSELVWTFDDVQQTEPKTELIEEVKLKKTPKQESASANL